MPAGIYKICKERDENGPKRFYRLCDELSLQKVLREERIREIGVDLGQCRDSCYVDEQGWPNGGDGKIDAKEWHLNEEQLLMIAKRVIEEESKRKDLGELSPTTHRWATNITPRRNLNPKDPTSPKVAFLAEIKEVWGYKYLCWTHAGCWTPIMVRFEVLWLDKCLGSKDFPSPQGKDQPVQKFPAPLKPGKSFFEFFYINRKGDFSAASQYSQAALFPDALKYFVKKMRSFLKRP
jgi:hypothetical protein